MSAEHTTAVVQRYLDALAGDSPPSRSSAPCSTGRSGDSTCSAPTSCTASTPA